MLQNEPKSKWWHTLQKKRKKKVQVIFLPSAAAPTQQSFVAYKRVYST
jgi:hypothetical protein